MVIFALSGQAKLCAQSSAVGQQLEGSWLGAVTVDPTPNGPPAPPPGALLHSFTRDGLMFVQGSTAPPPIPALANVVLSDGFGQWVRTGDRQFGFTFIRLLNRGGEFVGILKIRGTLQLDDGLNTANGTFTAEFQTPDGSPLLPASTGTFKEKRIAVEPQ